MKEEVKLVNTEDLIEIRAQVLADEIIEKEKAKSPSEEDLLELKLSVMLEEEKEKLRSEFNQKALIWAEEKAKSKALIIAEEERNVSIDMKIFQDEQIRLGWLFEQKALPEGDTAGQVMMKIRIGKQLGLNEYQSITGLAFIKGKLAIWGKVFVGLVTIAGYKIKFEEWTNKICKCTISNGKESMSDVYTIEDAKLAGLYPSNPYSPWTRHTKKMLAYKVVNNITSFLCPHIVGGAIIADDAREELAGEIEINIPNKMDIENTIANKFKN